MDIRRSQGRTTQSFKRCLFSQRSRPPNLAHFFADENVGLGSHEPLAGSGFSPGNDAAPQFSLGLFERRGVSMGDQIVSRANEIGSLSQCIVDGDSDVLTRARRLRRKALAVSVAFAGALCRSNADLAAVSGSGRAAAVVYADASAAIQRKRTRGEVPHPSLGSGDESITIRASANLLHRERSVPCSRAVRRASTS